MRPEVLGEALQISTTPVREALQSLRVEGFLELVPRKGFQVAPLTGKDIRDIFRVQALIGGELAARATLNASDSALAELEALHHELIAAAAREPDPKRRFEIFAEAEQILISTAAPICPLYYYVGIQFYDRTRLGGIEPNLLDEHPLKNIYWKKR